MIRNFSRPFIAVGDILTKISPGTALHLKQSDIDEKYNISAREYLAVCFFISLSFAILSFSTITLILSFGTKEFIGLAPIIGIVIGLLVYMQLSIYPKMIVNKRVNDLEKNLLFALRTILVQIRSGIPVFDAFVSIATGDYGQISNEFRIVIEKSRAGIPVIDALEELAVRNPSIYFRRAIWQLLNAIKSGSDVGDNLIVIIESISKEQMVQIETYKSVLNPLAMMYMMIAVITPSLGITIMIILSTFPGMEKLGNETIFWLLLVGIIFMQFIFMNIIKSRRPNLLG
ncbi:MAG: type II secretion system F family protein [Candidatus Altiarchaeota archaeon]|nr:type II secretion system F family protein [Candidatus Altiarchaeota archaeon]